ncbi:DUF3307 domain-containing protein [Polaribacter sp. SA4-12]|uniref:DUF3307 domain-containing protein n=1 Tax=Polaribacter sp. SA4-12 TaxID=1312072 RepID=UPI000B3C2686|nr:DUF3307 domain-containing protein [Polaribacter sp. SA4-12]ARV14353.1 hypothetical protein BTO07_03930 [Polaribacter sp. SA4-12]
MLLFLKILLAHILGDFVFQSKKDVKNKEEKKIKSSKLYLHIGIHSLLLLIFLQFNLQEYWLGFIIIIVSHFIFDVSKIYLQNKKTKSKWFFLDQILHLSILFLTTSIYTDFNLSTASLFNSETLILLITIVLLTNVSAIIIKVIINEWTPKNKENNDESLAKAGTYIGIIERLLIFIFIIIKQWELIGFLIAAKSFRFSGLNTDKKRNLTEYYFIGTLLSFGLAIIIGILYSHLKSII